LYTVCDFCILTDEMTLSEELQWRGFIQQTTFTNLTDLDSQTRTFYHGFDASADSQTIGNLAAMMFDKVFIRHGWKAILLAGGATSLIGDPGGKDKERPMQLEESIAHNVKRAEEELKKVFGDDYFMLVNNLDWTKDMKVLDFLRDVGKHFSMTPLVQRDYIAQRIGENGTGISYTEFSYTLLQGMDYLHLFDTYNVTMQLGGSDQWGNCLSGVELVRKARGAEVHTMTLPLIINKSTGKKFGKSEDGAVWLNEDKTSVYKFYQFWINSDDEGVESYLKVYTTLEKPVIDDIMQAHNEARSNRLAQKHLAYEVTKIVHGEIRAKSVQKLSETLFGGEDYSQLSTAEFEELKTELPLVQAKIGDDLTDLLIQGKLAQSKGEARRFLQSNAVYINGTQPPLDQSILDEADCLQGYALLRRGKNAQALIEIIG
jgi:tyrosyl-tRNA synthetase